MEENECKECLDFEAVEKNSTFCKHCMSCFPKQEKEDIIEAIVKFNLLNLSDKDCINNSKGYSKEKFQRKRKKTFNFNL